MAMKKDGPDQDSEASDYGDCGGESGDPSSD